MGARSTQSPCGSWAGALSFVVPYNEEFHDAVNVSVMGTDFYGEDEDEFGEGSRAVVFPRDRELKLDVQMSRAKYQPGDDAVAQMSLRTSAGRRAEGAFGVVVFDRAVEERAARRGVRDRVGLRRFGLRLPLRVGEPSRASRSAT